MLGSRPVWKAERPALISRSKKLGECTACSGQRPAGSRRDKLGKVDATRVRPEAALSDFADGRVGS
jgi:hypothetical protein